VNEYGSQLWRLTAVQLLYIGVSWSFHMFPCKWEGCKHWRARADELSRVMRKKLYGLLSVCYPDIHAENAGWYWWYLISRFDTIGMTGVIPSPGTLMQLGGQWLQVQVTFSWDVLMFLCERTPQAGVLWDQFVDEGTSGKSIYAINLWSMMMERKREREREITHDDSISQCRGRSAQPKFDASRS
jgi:hypothetical protein